MLCSMLVGGKENTCLNVDPVVKDYHFTGDLERYESINVFLNFIETGGDVKFKTEGKTIIIGKK